MIFYWVEIGRIELIIWRDRGQLALLLYLGLLLIGSKMDIIGFGACEGVNVGSSS